MCSDTTDNSEIFNEEEIIQELQDQGIARSLPEHTHTVNTCRNDGCDSTVPKNSYKTLNLGASGGFCTIDCRLEWEVENDPHID